MYSQILLLDQQEPQMLSEYLTSGGYSAFEEALKNSSPDDLIDVIKQAHLRGRGGAGFPTGLKWSFIPKQSDRAKWLLCNADEGEPCTFKDRVIMEQTPHQLLEGMALASYAIGSHTAYIYIRGEYVLAAKILEQAIQECRDKGILGKNIFGSGFDLDIHVHRGAGAYICGEETALIESLEGKRGQPRYKPPFPAVEGFYRGPTAVNNVETLACVPHIVKQGAKWFLSIGNEKCPGPKLFCLSGHVRKPGVYELPMGTPLRQLIEEQGGGTLSGGAIKGVIPGGVSSPVLPESALDVAMDFDSLAEVGSMLGSGGVIVMQEGTCMVKVAHRIIHFFSHESCGKCTPCREGLTWVEKVLRRIESGNGKPGDIDELDRLCGNIAGNTFCMLGDGAIMALRGLLNNYRSEFEQHISRGHCAAA